MGRTTSLSRLSPESERSQVPPPALTSALPGPAHPARWCFSAFSSLLESCPGKICVCLGLF